MLKNLLIVLCFAFPVYADEGQYQDIPQFDVIGDITKAPDALAVPPAPEVVEVPQVDTEKLAEEFKKNQEIINQLNDQLKQMAEEMKKNTSVKMVNPLSEPKTEVIGDNFNLVTRVQNLEASLGKLEAGELTPALDKRVREIAIEEYTKIKLEITNQVTGKRVTKEVVLGGTEVSVNGYSGTFLLNPGETISSIDGVPVQSYSQTVNTNQGMVTNHVGATNNTIVNGRPLPNRGFMLNISRPPARRFQQTLSTCRMVNGVKVCN